MDSRHEVSRYPSRGNPIIYGADHTAAGQLPRTSYGLLNQNLPAELSAAQTRRCLTLKKQMQISCKVIDMNVHFVEQTLKRRGGFGTLRLCGKAIADSYKSLQEAADEFIDILGYVDCEAAEVSVYDLMTDTQDCVESVLITLEDILEPFRYSEMATTIVTIGVWPAPVTSNQQNDVDPQPPSQENYEPRGDEELQHLTCLSSSGSSSSHAFDSGETVDREKSAEQPNLQAYTDEEPDESERDYDEGYESLAGVDGSLRTQDEGNDVQAADRAKLVSRTIRRECRHDEIDVREQPHVRDVKQQEKGKELDELAVLRYRYTTDLAQDGHEHSHSAD